MPLTIKSFLLVGITAVFLFTSCGNNKQEEVEGAEVDAEIQHQ